MQATLGYARKYAIAVMRQRTPRPSKPRRPRTLRYQAAMPVIQKVWEALDYPCAERLHPMLLQTARQLARHGEVHLTPEIQHDLAHISRATLARRIARWQRPSARRVPTGRRLVSKLRSEIPVESYRWDEDRPGALEIDLVQHDGGAALGHFAYTLSVVDVVTGYSRRQAVLGRGRTAVLEALRRIIDEWPYPVWAIHSDNGSEFINDHLQAFVRARHLQYTRSRPYHKNDNPHVEQKNRFLVRDVVGYGRYDTPEHVQWLNTVYRWLDTYANACMPMRKLKNKWREGGRVRKRYDQAATPVQRMLRHPMIQLDRQAWETWASSYTCPRVNPDRRDRLR
ncbi:transposase [Alicyclobacillus sendaiensis]|uniref:Transposase n=1 Tax=Alicyclobacillus sendaiensis PA2 TaxID=3029425 RepID=A0ABT6Y1D0_ALISE|nr:transposase [Alicyclobacillus sendaiensis]MDI9261164.1 transposase [Alicyclobacillus sendaiensis PA2]